jgi:hypothetical protein
LTTTVPVSHSSRSKALMCAKRRLRSGPSIQPSTKGTSTSSRWLRLNTAISPARGTTWCTRHRKSCACSTSLGALKAATRTPSGLVRSNTARAVPSLPEVSSPCSMSSSLCAECGVPLACPLA